MFARYIMFGKEVFDINRDECEAETGYRPFTTFFMDLSIADNYGKAAILETYDRVVKEWGHNVKYFTEFALMLSMKAVFYYDVRKNMELNGLYADLYDKARDFAYENFDENGRRYFYEHTD